MITMEIDVTKDFTQDSPHYWDNFWNNRDGLGGGSSDPDAHSQLLQLYHTQLWSKKLPNGEFMQLFPKQWKWDDKTCYYLEWNGMSLSSDSILPSFRYKRMKAIIENLKGMVYYNTYIEEFLHKACTIGGYMLWPNIRVDGQNTINQERGCNNKICDRFDRTLECIRRFYIHEASPMSQTLEIYRSFFDSFIDFRGFVDFWLLQDCVTPDYKHVIMWLGDESMFEPALPKTVDEYFHWIDCQLEFVEKRNQRIAKSQVLS